MATPGQVDHHDRVSNDAVIGWIREIVLDCAEPWALARFWAGLLGGTPVQWYPGWVTLEPPHTASGCPSRPSPRTGRSTVRGSDQAPSRRCPSGYARLGITPGL